MSLGWRVELAESGKQYSVLAMNTDFGVTGSIQRASYRFRYFRGSSCCSDKMLHYEQARSILLPQTPDVRNLWGLERGTRELR